MRLINFNEELTFKLPTYDDDTFVKYIEEFFNMLHYQITIATKESKNHCVGISEFIVMLNSKRNEFTVEIPETYPDIVFKFKKTKRLSISEKNRQAIFSLVLNVPKFVGIAKRVKTFLDLEKEAINVNASFKNGFVYFNLTGTEQFVDPVKNIAKEFFVEFDSVIENGIQYLKFPLERFMQLGYSNNEISILMHLVMSAFKYIYTIEAGGQDFTKRCQLKAELEKWKITAQNEVSEILKNRF